MLVCNRSQQTWKAAQGSSDRFAVGHVGTQSGKEGRPRERPAPRLAVGDRGGTGTTVKKHKCTAAPARTREQKGQPSPPPPRPSKALVMSSAAPGSEAATQDK